MLSLQETAQDGDTQETETSRQEPSAAGPKRNVPGTRADKFGAWEPEILEEMESLISSQQYIQQLIRLDCSNVDDILSIPEDHDPTSWMYEHLRQFCIELNCLVSMLEKECTRDTCSEMKASSYSFLCAAHSPPTSCCAIDYIAHTLDQSTFQLNSSKIFPSRSSISESTIQIQSSIARRLYRIFAHSWFHHKELFMKYETQYHVYHRYFKFINGFQLINSDALIIPNEALLGN